MHKRALLEEEPLDEKSKKRKTEDFNKISANLAVYQQSLKNLGISIDGFNESEGKITAKKINTSVQKLDENFEALKGSFKIHLKNDNEI